MGGGNNFQSEKRGNGHQPHTWSYFSAMVALLRTFENLVLPVAVCCTLFLC